MLTMLRIMEEKGYPRREKQGLAFVDLPLPRRDQARHSAIQRLVTQLFNDFLGLLVINIIENEQIGVEAFPRLKKYLENIQ